MSFMSVAQTSRVVKFNLWDEKPAPHSSTITNAETIDSMGRIANSAQGRVELFLPNKKPLATVIICPGGGYGILASEHEGRQFARFLNEHNIAGAVLLYRMPAGQPEIPLEDAQRTMEILKHGETQWGIDTAKIGVMGFSAGGNLAANIAVRFSPAFAVLYYPVITSEDKLCHIGSFRSLTGSNDKSLWDKYSAEKHVSRKTPPTLLFHSSDDKAVPIQNSELFLQALRDSGVDGELVIYPTGGHGWGFFTHFEYHEQMKQKLTEWLAKQCR